MSNPQAINAIIFRLQQQVDDLKMQLAESDKKFEMENRDHLWCRNLIEQLDRDHIFNMQLLKEARAEIERQRAIIARQRDMFNESSENEEIRLRAENERLRALIEGSEFLAKSVDKCGECHECGWLARKWLKDAGGGD